MPTIKEWSELRGDWIKAPEIDQDEESTEKDYDDAVARWYKMGAAEKYKHQDENYSRMCNLEWCRCKQ